MVTDVSDERHASLAIFANHRRRTGSTLRKTRALKDELGESRQIASDLMRNLHRLAGTAVGGRERRGRGVQESDKDLSAQAPSDEGETRASHSALLIQRSSLPAVPRGRDVIAEVAASLLLASVLHHQVRVKAQRCIDQRLLLSDGLDSGQPPTACETKKESEGSIRRRGVEHLASRLSVSVKTKS